MKQAYEITDGAVTNTIMLDDAADPADFGAVSGPLNAAIGWTLKDGFWSPPDQPPVPQAPFPSITARQLRLGLLKIDIKPDDVTTAIAGLPEGQREEALIEWQYASTFERSHPLIAIMGTVFKLTDAQIDAAWLNAATL